MPTHTGRTSCNINCFSLRKPSEKKRNRRKVQVIELECCQYAGKSELRWTQLDQVDIWNINSLCFRFLEEIKEKGKIVIGAGGVSCFKVISWNLLHVCKLSHFSRAQLFVTPWTVAHQSPLSMGFSRQEYQSGLPYSPPGDLPDPGIESISPVSPALEGRFFTTEPPNFQISLRVKSKI